MEREEIVRKTISILLPHGATKIAIFGSHARREAGPESDLDVLAEFSETKSLLEMVGIEMGLSEPLAIKVDLLTEAALSPYLIDRIKSEAEVVYR